MATDPDPQLTELLHQTVPLAAPLGMEVLEASARRVRIRSDWAPERCTAGGVLHGGFLMALADTAGAYLAFLNLPAGAAGTTTVESKTNFLAAVTEGAVTATAEPLSIGRRLIVVVTDIHRQDQTLAARTTQTQMALT